MTYVDVVQTPAWAARANIHLEQHWTLRGAGASPLGLWMSSRTEGEGERMAVCFCKSKRSQRPARASLGTECAWLPEATHLVLLGWQPLEGPDCLRWILSLISLWKEGGWACCGNGGLGVGVEKGIWQRRLGQAPWYGSTHASSPQQSTLLSLQHAFAGGETEAPRARMQSPAEEQSGWRRPRPELSLSPPLSPPRLLPPAVYCVSVSPSQQLRSHGSGRCD